MDLSPITDICLNHFPQKKQFRTLVHSNALGLQEIINDKADWPKHGHHENSSTWQEAFEKPTFPSLGLHT